MDNIFIGFSWGLGIASFVWFIALPFRAVKEIGI